MTKTRAFLEYYVKAAAGVPAGQWARDALAELDGLEAAAEARGFERAKVQAEGVCIAFADVFEASPDDYDAGKCAGGNECAERIRAMQDEQRGGEDKK